jgi:hypothetical protein
MLFHHMVDGFYQHLFQNVTRVSYLPFDSDHYSVFQPLIHITSGTGRTKSGTNTHEWGHLGPLSMGGSNVQIPRNQFGLI